MHAQQTHIELGRDRNEEKKRTKHMLINCDDSRFVLKKNSPISRSHRAEIYL